MQEVINTCDHEDILNQILIFSEKHKTKNLYISFNCQCSLLVKCTTKTTLNLDVVKLTFEGSDKKAEIIITGCYNKAYQGSMFQVNYIKSGIGDNAFIKEFNNDPETDCVLFCNKDEQILLYEYARKDIHEYICLEHQPAFINLSTGIKNDYTGIRPGGASE